MIYNSTVGTGFARLAPPQTGKLTDNNQLLSRGILNSGACKICQKKRSSDWVKRNKERQKKNCAEWYANNKEKVKVTGALYYKKNKALVLEKRKEYRKKNIERKKIVDAKYRTANREKVRNITKNWKVLHPESLRINNQNRRALKKLSGGKISKDLVQRLYKLQQGKCPCCKNPLNNDYHLDHVIPLSLGGTNDDLNMQLLRSICNLQKNAKHPIDFMQSRGYLL